jgi:membrane-associated phospholipid phosphatase
MKPIVPIAANPPMSMRLSVARWISIVAHPFVTGLLLVGISAGRSSTPTEATRTVTTFLLIAVMPVALLMIRQVRRGAWQNVDASNVSERPVLFLVGTATTLLLLGWFSFVRPQPSFVRGTVGCLGMIAVCAIATRWIKVSLHVAFAAVSGTLLLLVGSRAGWLLAIAVPLLAWSRVVLGRHTALEVLLGCLVGIVTGLAGGLLNKANRQAALPWRHMNRALTRNSIADKIPRHAPVQYHRLLFDFFGCSRPFTRGI